eukprot:6377920-Amphidinium_carterae.1
MTPKSKDQCPTGSLQDQTCLLPDDDATMPPTCPSFLRQPSAKDEGNVPVCVQGSCRLRVLKDLLKRVSSSVQNCTIGFQIQRNIAKKHPKRGDTPSLFISVKWQKQHRQKQADHFLPCHWEHVGLLCACDPCCLSVSYTHLTLPTILLV